MGLLNIIKPSSQVQNSQGRPLAGGSVYLYEPGTTTFVTAYGDSGLINALPQPVVLSGSGRANIWITRDVDMFIFDRNGNSVLQELNANPDELNQDSGSGLVPNGSFELDTDVNDVPDGWTEVAEAGSSNGIDTTRSTDGAQSFRFTSTGVGGGSLTTTDFFPVTDLADLSVTVDIQGSVLGPNNRVRIEWYTVLFASISNTDIYNSTTTPIGVWTSLSLSGTPPLTARFAKLRLIGIDPSVPFSGSTWFDRVNVFYPVTSSGIFDNITIQNNEIISTNTNGTIEIKPNGTGELRLGQGSAGVPRYAADALGGVLNLQKSRGASYGTQTIVQSGDTLGALGFAGSSGSAFVVAADIVGAVDGTPGATNDMPGRLVFRTAADGTATLTERLRINQNGQAVFTVGGAYVVPAQLGGFNPGLALQGNTVGGGWFSGTQFTADTQPAAVLMRKSRNATVGSHTIVQASDGLGSMLFYGSDGVGFIPGAAINATVDGTPGVNDMPTRLTFATTADGAAAVTERMRIGNDGAITILQGGSAFNSIATMGGGTPALNVYGSTSNGVSIMRFEAGAGNPAFLFIGKSRSGTMGGQTIVAASDQVGAIDFRGSDGVQMLPVAGIRAAIDGTPGVNDMPGRLEFSVTQDGAAVLTQLMRLRSSSIRMPLVVSPDLGANYHSVPMLQYQRRSSDLSRASTTTFADDPVLSGFQLQPNSVYEVKAVLSWSMNGSTANDWKWNFDFNGQIGNVTILQGLSFSAGDGGAVDTFFYCDDAQVGVGNCSSAGQISKQYIEFIVETNGSYVAGTAVDFQWAQNTSDVTNTTLLTGSWIKVTKIA